MLENKFVQGAIAGFLSAAVVDFAAFRAWKSFREATTYDWRTAAWRWLQGIVVGVVTAAGLEGVS